MIHVTLDDLPVDKKSRLMIGKAKGVEGAVVVGTDRVIVYGPDCDFPDLAQAWRLNPGAHSAWIRGSNEPNSRVARALIVMQAGFTANAAAKLVGVNASAVYRAQKLRAELGSCTACGALTRRARRRPVAA